jgi:serine/threonine protein kinase/tetratricopeptide (TPR) repeat protein
MTPEHWRKVEELFDAALDQESSERAAFLVQACPDEAVRGEVESLLANASSRTVDLWPAPRLLADRTGALSAGDQIGAYRIVHSIEIGGMGEVYEAEEDPPAQRKVAIKVMRQDLNGPRSLARFDGERRALAVMSHPHIAQIFASGTVGGGRPYFVMELVEGQPITRFCDDHRLPIRKRLELFVQVCRGMQHAHQKGVLHRDIKPSNVLVTLLDGKPVPKIIDFGICVALDATQRPLQPLSGERIGTFDYMSPEQKAGSDLDTRTDVYSLGLLLFELLVGHRLPAMPEGGRAPVASREADRPDNQIREIAACRSTEPQALVRTLQGDLDWILAKALESDRERRYSSAADLASDLERHAADQPVVAGPPSRAYRVRKFLRRHRLGATAAALATFALLVGVAGLVTGLVRARRAEVQARTEAARASREAEASRRISNFMVDLFAASEPERAQGTDLTARELLDRGAQQLTSGLERQSTVRSALLAAIGKAYLRLGLFDASERQLQQAIEAARRQPGGEPGAVTGILNTFGELRRLQARYEEARGYFQEALELESGPQEPSSPAVAESLNGLGLIHYNQGKLAEAEPYFQRASILWRQAGDPREGTALGHLALLARDQGHVLQAIELFERAQTSLEAAVGPQHPDVQGNLNNLAELYRTTGQLQQAETLLRRVLAVTERVLGPEHPLVAVSLNNLAMVLTDQARYEEAEDLYRRVLRIEELTKGPDHPDFASTLNNLATLYRRQERYKEAEPLLRRALAIRLRTLGPKHFQVATTLYYLGWVHQARGDFAEAERLYMRALTIREEALGPMHSYVAAVLGRLGDLYRETGRLRAAEELLRRAVAIRDATPQPDKLNLATTLETLTAVLERTGRKAEAARHLARAKELRRQLAEASSLR